MSTEKDVGVNITNSLTWNTHIHAITAKANKLLGLLKRTCPLLNDVSARRSLYLALVKSQLSYATQVWSPDKIALKTQIERVQRRATRWILKQRVGVMSYRDRLLTLKLLPLTFDRELKDLVFFYKCRNGFTDLNVYDFVSPVSHGRTRLSNSYNLKTPVCKTSTFQASYFNRIVKLWNYISVNFHPLPVFQLLLPSATLLLSTCFTFCTITLTYPIPVPGQLYDPAPAIPSFLASFKFGVFWLIVF